MASGLATLKTRADFLRVAASGRRAVRPGLMLQAAATPSGVDGSGIDRTTVRVGFTASRKIGNAVARNRAKRRLRAVAAALLPRDGQPGTDYVLVARAGTGQRDYEELLGDLASALRQIARQPDRTDQTAAAPRPQRRIAGRRGTRRRVEEKQHEA